MNWNRWIRKAHRWLSTLFTVAVVANIAMMGAEEPVMWVGFLALVPLIPLLLTGLYLLVLPWVGKRNNAALDGA